MPAPTSTDLPTAFRSPGLARLWASSRKRLERNGLDAIGSLILYELTDQERYDLSGLLARSITGHRVTVDLARLDLRLRESPAGRGLAAVLEALGGPLVDRKSINAESTAERTALWAAAREATVVHDLARYHWCDDWLTALRRRRVVSHLEHTAAVRVVRDAARCLAQLPRLDSATPPSAVISRNDLAVRIDGSAHGLDDDKPLAVAVLLAVAAARGVEPPTSSAARRHLWHGAGVLTDQVSATVLTLGLQPAGDGARNVELRARAVDAVETHLNARDVARIDWSFPPGTMVSICENPRVVEAAADAGVRKALVCTSGNPTLVVSGLLDQLAGARVTFRYHGDFDWSGLAIAARVIERVNATPWRFGAADYVAAVDSAGTDSPLPELEGTAVTARWDPALTAAMRQVGRAVHEEAVLDELVADLLEP